MLRFIILILRLIIYQWPRKGDKESSRIILVYEPHLFETPFILIGCLCSSPIFLWIIADLTVLFFMYCRICTCSARAKSSSHFLAQIFFFNAWILFLKTLLLCTGLASCSSLLWGKYSISLVSFSIQRLKASMSGMLDMFWLLALIIVFCYCEIW